MVAQIMQTGERLEAGLQVVCSEFTCVFHVKVEESPNIPPQETAQYLNVRQISQNLLLLYTMIVRSQSYCPRGNFCMGNPNLFPNNLARQQNRYTSVTIDAQDALREIIFRSNCKRNFFEVARGLAKNRALNCTVLVFTFIVINLL